MVANLRGRRESVKEDFPDVQGEVQMATAVSIVGAGVATFPPRQCERIVYSYLGEKLPTNRR